jgi:multisubunit Na+/H+ antiporter MnhE subunit
MHEYYIISFVKYLHISIVDFIIALMSIDFVISIANVELTKPVYLDFIFLFATFLYGSRKIYNVKYIFYLQDQISITNLLVTRITISPRDTKVF